MNGFLTDIRIGVRRLRSAPLFTIFAALSLGLGLSVTTAFYSIVDSLFLKENAGIVEPARVAVVMYPMLGRFTRALLSRPDYDDLRASQTSFARLSASSALVATISTPASTESVSLEAVADEYFAALGAGASVGRVIAPGDQDASSPAIVLSERLWRARFRSDPSVVGQRVRVGGLTFEVVGVARPDFGGASGSILGSGTSAWIPLAAAGALQDDASGQGAARDRRTLQVFGRLKSGVSADSASAEVSTIASRLDSAFPPRSGRQTDRPWKARPLTEAGVGAPERRIGLLLVALVCLVLVVACTNLSNLVLSRGATRRHEFAVRSALGASRWRLVREQAVESLLIAILGGVAAWLTFQALSVVMTTEFNLPLPNGSRVTIDIQPTLSPDALIMAGVSLLIALVVFGLEPAIQLTRARDLRSELSASGGSIGDLKPGRQRVLLRWQVAVSACFFIIATMFVRATIEEARHDPGVELNRLAVAALNTRAQGWDALRRSAALDRALASAPMGSGASIAVSSGLPFGGPPRPAFKLSVPGAIGDGYRALGIAASPAIFRTLGVAILRGRGFDDRDLASAPAVAVISDFTGHQLFRTSDPLGQHIIIRGLLGESAATIVGIARDTDVGRLFSEPMAFVYMPLAQRREQPNAVLVRAANAATALRTLTATLRRADPDFPVDAAGTGRALLVGPFELLRSAGMAAIALGLITLLLAMVGLFGIQSQIVSRRTREIGVRMAFGATRGQIERMVLKDGYRPVIEGLALGLFAGLAGRVVVRAYVEFDMAIVDPSMFAIVPIPLLLAAFCACYLPARRAAGTNPNVALRQL